MRLVVISYKICWRVDSASQWLSYAGYPAQVAALSQLFDTTTLVLLDRAIGHPDSGVSLKGRSLSVAAFPEPSGEGLRRKITLLAWMGRHLPRLWALIRSADVVHALVPGDLGVIGIALSRLARRRLVVRHCGTWGYRKTLADRVLGWWLPRLARSGAIVFATGSDERPPQPEHPNLRWIFSTSLTANDLNAIELARPWQPGTPPRLVTVGRLTAGKNQAAVIEALPQILGAHPGATLEILGDGPARAELASLIDRLGLAETVRLRGNVGRAEVLATLGRSHLFVFPTRVAEGFPKAVLEALACGVPVLAAAVSVIPRLLSEGGGRLFAGTDPQAIADGVLGLLGEPAAMGAIGEAGRRTASRYTLERWRDEIGATLEQAWGPLREPTPSAP